MSEDDTAGLHLEGDKIIDELTALKEDMEENRPLRWLPSTFQLTISPIVDDRQPNLLTFNEELRRMNRPTWRNVSWLYSECYLYRYSPLSSEIKFPDSSIASLRQPRIGNVMTLFPAKKMKHSNPQKVAC
jgi:Damage-control phosphatase ARMT1-like domain